MQKGDRVRFLNSVGGGVIKKIEDNIAYVEEEDGFETPILTRELIIVQAAGSSQQPKDKAMKIPEKPKEITSEDNSKEKVNLSALDSPLTAIILAFNPQDHRHLSTTTFDTYLINDSDYTLYAVYMTRCSEQEGWVTRFCGMIEPQMQEWLDDFKAEDLNQMERIAVQYIAFSPNRPFAMKSPATLETRLDATKFFKLHCFKDSEYFDTPTLELPLVDHDRLVKAASLQTLNYIHKDEAAPQPKSKKINKPLVNEPLVVDLHAGELLDSTAGMSSGEILNYQIDQFRQVMDKNLKNKGKKIIFIHGKGEGVLRSALMKEFKNRYKHCDVQDASFREYGFGASQVTIR